VDKFFYYFFRLSQQNFSVEYLAAYLFHFNCY